MPTGDQLARLLALLALAAMLAPSAHRWFVATKTCWHRSGGVEDLSQRLPQAWRYGLLLTSLQDAVRVDLRCTNRPTLADQPGVGRPLWQWKPCHRLRPRRIEVSLRHASSSAWPTADARRSVPPLQWRAAAGQVESPALYRPLIGSGSSTWTRPPPRRARAGACIRRRLLRGETPRCAAIRHHRQASLRQTPVVAACQGSGTFRTSAGRTERRSEVAVGRWPRLALAIVEHIAGVRRTAAVPAAPLKGGRVRLGGRGFG